MAGRGTAFCHCVCRRTVRGHRFARLLQSSFSIFSFERHRLQPFSLCGTVLTDAGYIWKELCVQGKRRVAGFDVFIYQVAVRDRQITTG